jgi:hypothetical protein
MLLLSAVVAGAQDGYRADALFLAAELDAAYANMDMKEARFGFCWDSLAAAMVEDAGKVDNDRDFYLLASRCLARLHDGHLAFRYGDGRVRSRILSYPDPVIGLLGLRLIEDRVVVVSAPEQLGLAGEELQSIGGVPVDTILNRMDRVYALRGMPEANRSQLLVYNRFWDYFDLFEGRFPDTLRLVVGDAGHAREVVVGREHYDAPKAVLQGIRWGLPEENPGCRYAFSGDNTALLTIPTFELGLENFAAFMEAFDDSCRQRGVQGLVIDLRYNGGGNESFRELLSYLATDTLDILYYRYRLSESFYRSFPGRLERERQERTTVMPATLPGYSEWFAWQVFPKAGSYLSAIPVVVLSNENVFSSTGNFLYAVRKHGLATIVGNAVPLTGHGLGKPELLPQGRFTLKNCYFESRGTGFETLENSALTPDRFATHTMGSVQKGIDNYLLEAEEEIGNKRGEI